MNVEEAIEGLKPFTNRLPTDALDTIRKFWAEAGPILLSELDAKLKRPREQDSSALFLYALYLCGEMREEQAFDRYLAMCRLPNLVLDSLLGDILTEAMPEMLARTCSGRIDDLKALAEDQTVNEFARAAALQAMQNLMLDGHLSRDALMGYCIQLLKHQPAWPASHVWDAVIEVATDIHPQEAMPLIEKAYALGLADPQVAGLDFVKGRLSRSREEVLAETRRMRRELTSTEEAMHFFVSQWSEQDQPEEPEDDAPLLEVLKAHRRQGTVSGDTPKVGRNDPCPCGSRKKFKKCCLGNPVVENLESVSVLNRPIRPEHVCANDWMEAGYILREQHLRRDAQRCWTCCWEELQALLPDRLPSPSAAEETGAFVGCDFLVNWIQDFQDLLEESSEHSLHSVEYGLQFCDEVLERFPMMDDLMQRNTEVMRARLLGLAGRGREALRAMEDMIEVSPDMAQGYVALADILTFDAEQMNIEPDPQQAIRLLRAALEHADDCEDYDVQVRLEDLERAQGQAG